MQRKTRRVFIWLSENRESGASDHEKTRKAPGALDPAVVLPPLGGVKYVTVTQDKSAWLCSERHDEYFFGRAKTGGLGQVTTKKKTTEKKTVLLDPVLMAG